MMARLRRAAGRLRGLFYRKHEEQLLDDELRAYLDASIGQPMARGLSRAEAVRAARVALGSLDAVKEAVRDVGWETLADAAAQDVRRAVRCLRSRPMTSLAAIGMLGLGIASRPPCSPSSTRSFCGRCRSMMPIDWRRSS